MMLQVGRLGRWGGGRGRHLGKKLAPGRARRRRARELSSPQFLGLRLLALRGIQSQIGGGVGMGVRGASLGHPE